MAGPVMPPPGTITVQKKKSVNHGDFFRILPKALDGADYRIDGSRIVAGCGDRRLEITLSAQSERRIALLTLPVTHVRLDFIGYGGEEAAAALARFDRGFQRGGG